MPLHKQATAENYGMQVRTGKNIQFVGAEIDLCQEVRIPYLKTIRTSISDGSLQPDLHF
jgi:hypothetical protein